jgi:hypothetical protein
LPPIADTSLRTTFAIFAGEQLGIEAVTTGRVFENRSGKCQTMSKLTIQLPDLLQRSIEALAEQEGYSIDQFLASAAAEKMAAIKRPRWQECI